VVLNCDDGLGDTIRPRLDRSEADLTRVSAITGLSDGSRITLADVDMLESALVKLRPALVVVDPIQGFLGRINAPRANEVRPLLAGLGGLAEKYRTAILCIRHLRKSGADRALYRGMGSVDFAAAARSVLLAGQDPSDHGRRALVHLKSSLAPNGTSIGYTLNGGGFKWAGVSNLTADDLLRPDTSPEERSAQDEAKAFLRDTLAGGPVPVKDVKKQAREAGIAYRTLKRAKQALKVRSERESVASERRGAGQWGWTLPGQERQPPQRGTLAPLKNAAEPLSRAEDSKVQEGQRGPLEDRSETVDSTANTPELQGGQASRASENSR